MKYYELYADAFWLITGGNKIYLTELIIEKDTLKQLTIEGSKSHSYKFNKSKLMTVQGDSSKYIIFPEGKEDEARKLLKESLERGLSYYEERVRVFSKLVEEVSNG